MQAQVRHALEPREHLRYHEQKVTRDKAECLYAENFMKDADRLTLHDKVYHFERLNSLRLAGGRRMLDVSLNFHPKDVLTNTDIVAIARQYIARLDLDAQPYLVYRHHDAAHPHVHVVVGMVNEQRERIEFTPKMLHRSKEICREMEKRYSLVISGQGMRVSERGNDRAQRLVYGQQPTMPAMSNILNRVLPQYKYTSLEELNAVLRLYNVEAYTGRPDSNLYRHRGLLYRVLDEHGNSIGSSIQASHFDSKPTLRQLEKKFALNQAEAERPVNKLRVRTAVELALRKDATDIPGLQKRLEKEQISLVMLMNKIGGLVESFFVDHQNRTVYAGASLGAGYDRQSLEQRCVPTEVLKEAPAQALVQRKDQRENISKHLL